MPRKAVPLYGGTPQSVSTRVGCPTPLDEWLIQNGVASTTLARRIGCHLRMVDHWRLGKVMPGLVYAFRIEQATGGGVPVAAWMGTERAKAEWSIAETRKKERGDG